MQLSKLQKTNYNLLYMNLHHLYGKKKNRIKKSKNKPALFRTSAGLNKLKAKNYFYIRSSIRFLPLI
ncbi:hypothetical protein D0809_10230 [Flavobacterium circumlabens]|uniref:Uncharacterized protein n=1 Tax=Flavobacterium circumlabens TaxID=2133765 RepID=A0A4Y7UCR7_9FLAO|nr:hypothetical protein D0809_10230 [Flavobacterium circumlabens]